VTRPNLLFPITINLPKISELKKSSAEVKISNLIKYLAVYCRNDKRYYGNNPIQWLKPVLGSYLVWLVRIIGSSLVAVWFQLVKPNRNQV